MYYSFGSYSNWMSNADPLFNWSGEPSRESDLVQFTAADRSSLFSRNPAMDGMFRPRETYQDMLSRRASEWARKTDEMEAQQAMQNLFNNSLSFRVSNGSGTGNLFAAQSAPQWQRRATESERSSPWKEEPYTFRCNISDLNYGHSNPFSRRHFDFDLNLPSSDSKYRGIVKRDMLFDRSAGTLFSCTGMDYQCRYKNGKNELFARVGQHDASDMSIQSVGIGFEDRAWTHTAFELQAFRTHNHRYGETSSDCTACIAGKLNLDGIGASLEHAWSSDAETKCGGIYNMQSGGFVPFVEHKQKIDLGKGGDLRCAVRHPARGGSGFEATVSWVWNKLTMGF